MRHSSTSLATPFLSRLISAPNSPPRQWSDPVWAASLQGGEKEKGGKSGISLSFSRALCFALEVSSRSGLPVEPQIWRSRPAQGLAGTLTPTQPPASGPGPPHRMGHSSWPLSTAQHGSTLLQSCSETSDQDLHRTEETFYTLQPARRAYAMREGGRQIIHTQSQMALGWALLQIPLYCVPNNKSNFFFPN